MQRAVEAYAVDGKPADCTMLALHGPLFQAGNQSGKSAAVKFQRQSVTSDICAWLHSMPHNAIAHMHAIG